MPEYLSPGVYVEEIEIGAKPIEGVSTSTVGFVGMTERGPLNKPTLVTSFAEYQRTFGGYLSSDFGDYRYLPLAVEGFFSNGGQRAYITRVANKTNNDKKLNKLPANIASGFLPDISGAITQLSSVADIGDIWLSIQSAAGLKIDDELVLKGQPRNEFFKLLAIAKALNLNTSLPLNLKAESIITKMTQEGEYQIESNANSGDKTIVLNKISDDLANGTMLLIIDANPANSEICGISDVDKDSNSQTYKTITLNNPLAKDHNAGTSIKTLVEPTPPEGNITIIADSIQQQILIDYATEIAQYDVVKVDASNYFIVASIEQDPRIQISKKLEFSHNAKSEIQKLVAAIDITAKNEGTWGNRIRIEIDTDIDRSSILKTKLSNVASAGQNYLELETVVGIEAGTRLILPNGDHVLVDKVINSDNPTVIISNVLNSQLSEGAPINTSEFNLILHFDDYEEVYRSLSLEKTHSRYFETMIESSGLITAEKAASGNIVDLLPTKEYPEGWILSGGEDGIPNNAKEANTVYEGTDNLEPTERTGLHTLKNIDGISIVAIPGLSSTDFKNIQSKLINHCEIMGDRFAVLDSQCQADNDQIQIQRSLFDSKYAAIYYPWISIFDPLSQQQIDMPPSGHVCGIYARSDTERGVHKAPANEVVRGALDLEMSKIVGKRTIITKGQQDVLNPKGINCIRAFPGRGIRVWGARTISSDPLWRYVNVRRLFLYMEKSIEEGTQWVVFEPNDEKLWARVKQTINQFLMTVWRSGALMGATQDEAFFVKCDRSTMTQEDIDNGKLIVLIGVAPVKPAEFVIFRIAQVAKGSSIAG
ncbi:MAG: phage tail sheath subtilisin-like domain-containing protein [Methanothrix sp.]|nr:phage tail sheath subtilisin-like domain-containing protein [Methanothrix sp.]